MDEPVGSVKSYSEVFRDVVGQTPQAFLEMEGES
jgi:hypothetical protein